MKWHQTPNEYFMTLLYPCANSGCYKNHKYITLHPDVCACACACWWGAYSMFTSKSRHFRLSSRTGRFMQHSSVAWYYWRYDLSTLICVFWVSLFRFHSLSQISFSCTHSSQAHSLSLSDSHTHILSLSLSLPHHHHLLSYFFYHTPDWVAPSSPHKKWISWYAQWQESNRAHKGW